MRNIVLIFGLLCAFFSYGQYTFRGQLVDSLKITIGYGYEFHGTDSSGYDATHGWVKAQYDSINQCYKSWRWEEWHRETFSPGITTTVRKTLSDHLIKSPKSTYGPLDSLLTSKSSLTYGDFQFTRQQWKHHTKARVIDRYMKNNARNFRWIDRKEKLEFSKGFHSIDTFNLFLNQYLNPKNFVIITGYSDIISLDIYTKGQSFSLISRTGSLFRLPWWRSENDDIDSEEGILNLEINHFLLGWLPKDFFNRESLEPKIDIQNQYLSWYIDRSGLIY